MWRALLQGLSSRLRRRLLESLKPGYIFSQSSQDIFGLEQLCQQAETERNSSSSVMRM